MSRIVLAVLMGMAMMTAGMISDAQAADAGKGKLVYAQKCSSCHGKEGKGDGPFGKNLTPPAANFTDPAGTAKKSDTELLDKIAKGGRGTAMPAFKSLSADERANVLAYIRAMAGK
ncbi:MAG: cytochrome c [Nitrospirota bacterium]|nr:cytochrome c [Nitrospirota bacterium]